jgi:hypothetical protein
VSTEAAAAQPLPEEQSYGEPLRDNIRSGTSAARRSSSRSDHRLVFCQSRRQLLHPVNFTN